MKSLVSLEASNKSEMFLLLNDCPSTQTIRNKRWKERTIVRVDTLDILP